MKKRTSSIVSMKRCGFGTAASTLWLTGSRKRLMLTRKRLDGVFRAAAECAPPAAAVEPKGRRGEGAAAATPPATPPALVGSTHVTPLSLACSRAISVASSASFGGSWKRIPTARSSSPPARRSSAATTSARADVRGRESKMLGGARQIVSKIRVQCNGTYRNTHLSFAKSDGFMPSEIFFVFLSSAMIFTCTLSPSA